MNEANDLIKSVPIALERILRPHSRPSHRSIIFASLLFASLASSSACAHPKESSTDDGGARAASPASSVPALPASSAPVAAGLSPANLYGPKLALEAQGRPTGTPNAQAVFSAIIAAGVPLADQQQHVASTVGAHYCLGATSPSGLAMSACEYDTEAAALAGRDLSAKIFAKIEHRDITLNKKTTLTVLEEPFGPESQAAHDKAIAAFKKL